MRFPCRCSSLWLTAVGVALFPFLAGAADGPTQAAAKADKLLRSEVPYANAAKVAPAKTMPVAAAPSPPAPPATEASTGRAEDQRRMVLDQQIPLEKAFS